MKLIWVNLNKSKLSIIQPSNGCVFRRNSRDQLNAVNAYFLVMVLKIAIEKSFVCFVPVLNSVPVQNSSDACLFNNVPTNQLVAYKCGNCISRGLSANHKANDPSCPCRADYQNIRNNVRARNSNRSNRSNQQNSNSKTSIRDQNIHLISNQSNHLNSIRIKIHIHIYLFQ